ncbi:MAG: O-methyltransferase [bacterium]
MSVEKRSIDKVHFEFRPAKQVERRMLLEVFQNLMMHNYAISRYKYTGMGSKFFIDYILFHRYLGITRMLSVEISEKDAKRVSFNKPYGFIDVEIGDIRDFIPRLSPDLSHILWLDYDGIITREIIDTVILASSQLSARSILLVTVDVEPPGLPGEGRRKYGPASWRRYFMEEAEDYLPRSTRVTDFAKERLSDINGSIVDSAIRRGLRGRDALFIPMFNFQYADGHAMLSVGGMIGTDSDRVQLETLDRERLFYLRRSITCDPYRITVPIITRRERLYLDREMPCKDNWCPRDFEMERADILMYREIYKYYPAYTEMLL